MLRTSLRTVRALGNRPAATASIRQWQPIVARPAGLAVKRLHEESKSKVSKSPSENINTVSSTEPPPSVNETNVVDNTIPSENVPFTPPAPEDLGSVNPKNDTKAAVSPTPTPPVGKGFFRRLRNYFLTLVILGAVTFSGGVYYSRISDSFHDLFTKYIPFGERAVLYLEEAEFRKRFPNVSSRGAERPRDTGDTVAIPAQHGMSWRVADLEPQSGRQSSAVEKTSKTKQSVADKESEKSNANGVKVEEGHVPPPEAATEAAAEPVAVSVATPVKEKSKSLKQQPAADTEFELPAVNEPSRLPPMAPLQPIHFPNVDEAVVQSLSHMLNDIIAVINADGSHAKFATTIDKAKNELTKVYGEITQIKAAAEADAAAQLRARAADFDKAANDLVSRVEATMAAQEAEWQREFSEEMKRIKETYDERFKTMTEQERKLNEQKLKNRLLEQAIELKRQFADQIKKRIEEERDSRLGKLQDLSKSVQDLEKLAAGWDEVIDMNLRTQQLHLAVEAVRASLEDAANPRPFIKELVALKEIAADDSVVIAAIESINPVADQRGVSNSAELIDRFRRVASEVRKASLLPEDAGVASHASSYVLSKFLFKKQGLAAGDDVESILTRTQTLLEEGDLDAAAREMNGLTGWAKLLSRDWLGEVRKVLEVKQALDVIQTEVRLQSLKFE